MEAFEVLKWLVPGSVVAAALLTVWRWLTRSWQADMEIRVSRLKELAEFEKNIKAAYGDDKMDEFAPLIDRIKRPALEATASRIIVLRDKKSFWDYTLFTGGGAIAASALVSMSPLGEKLSLLLGIISLLGLVLIIVFIGNAIREEGKAKREAQKIVNDILPQPRR